MKAMEKRCIERCNPEIGQQVHVEYQILQQKEVTWDDKQNDQHHNRRKALLKFMNAGTKVILKYRLLKRLQKIKQFLADCTSKQEVRKKVE